MKAYEQWNALPNKDFDKLMIEKQEQRAIFMDEIEAQCKTYQPVGAPTPRLDMKLGVMLVHKNTDPTKTDTNDFNERVNWWKPEALKVLYMILGKLDDGPKIDERSCEAVDCLHPCYGEN